MPQPHLDGGRALTQRWWPATAVWTVSWLLMLGLDGRIDLANLDLLLVLGAAIVAIWSTPWASFAASAIAVLAFNFVFVPPRLTFAVVGLTELVELDAFQMQLERGPTRP